MVRARKKVNGDRAAGGASRFTLKISETGFAITFTGKCSKATADILRTAGGEAIGGNRWEFHERSLDCVLCQLNGSVALPPPWVLQALGPNLAKYAPRTDLSANPKNMLHAPLSSGSGTCFPSAWRAWKSAEGHKLMAYQCEAVEFGIRAGGRVLLADEMGLGKTAQALVLATQYADEWPLLVVSPASLCRNWADEALQWVPSLLLGPGESAVQIISKGSESPRRLARIVIVSYDLAARSERVRLNAQSCQYNVIICDEAHFLKSTKSKRSATLIPLLQRASRAILLSGTPVVNNAAEVFPLLDGLCPGLVPSEDDFVQRYCIPQKIRTWQRRDVVKWTGSARPHELHRLLLNTVMIRRLKDDVLPQLPAKRRQRLLMERKNLDQGPLKEVDELKNNFLNGIGRVRREAAMQHHPSSSEQETVVAELLAAAAEDLSGLESSARDGCNPLKHQQSKGNVKSVIAELARLTCEAKLNCAADYAETIAQSGTRFLLFAHHRAMLDALQARLQRCQIKHIRIDGSTPQHQRAQLVKQFQDGDEAQIALLSITACGQGLNFQSASLVVFAEMHWVIGQMLQAEDRVHRVGQNSAVNIQYMVAQSTLDEVVYSVLGRKHRDTTAILNGAREDLDADDVDVGDELADTACSEVSLPFVAECEHMPSTCGDLPANPKHAEGEAKYCSRSNQGVQGETDGPDSSNSDWLFGVSEGDLSGNDDHDSKRLRTSICEETADAKAHQVIVETAEADDEKDVVAAFREEAVDIAENSAMKIEVEGSVEFDDWRDAGKEYNSTRSIERCRLTFNPAPTAVPGHKHSKKTEGAVLHPSEDVAVNSATKIEVAEYAEFDELRHKGDHFSTSITGGCLTQDLVSNAVTAEESSKTGLLRFGFRPPKRSSNGLGDAPRPKRLKQTKLEIACRKCEKVDPLVARARHLLASIEVSLQHCNSPVATRNGPVATPLRQRIDHRRVSHQKAVTPNSAYVAWSGACSSAHPQQLVSSKSIDVARARLAGIVGGAVARLGNPSAVRLLVVPPARPCWKQCGTYS